jgi:F-type H+-transporting ATPase subunit alpha
VVYKKMKLDINLENETLTPQVGYTAASGDGVASAIGLLNTGAGELIFFPNSGVFGLTLNLFNLLVDIVVLGDDRSITQGDLLFPSGNPLQIPLTFSTIGTVTGGTGANVAVSKTDEYSDDLNTALYEITTKAPGIVCRQPVLETLQTGILAVDSIIPIGRGQRELIIGDRQTGKTTVAVDTIINQSNFPADKEQVYCVYTAIAQKRSNVRYLFERFRLSGAIFFTTIVSATSSEAASLHFLAPYTACAVGEFFKSHGLSSLVIYDDLTKHAMAYRQMSLLLRRSPGREAYPGDVFYIHSRLLERSAKMNFVYGNGSLTALPVIETQAGDVSAYIPTNVISITDGQIFLESQLFNKGIRPAINVGLSVSRIGSAAQLVGIKNVSSSIKLELAQFREVESFAFLGSELDDTTKATLNRGIRIVELLKQDKFSPLSPVSEIVLLFGGMRGYLDLLDISGVRLFKQILVKAVELIPTLSAEILVAQALVRYDLFIHLVTSNVVKVLLDPENKKENVGSGRSFDLPLV